MGSNTPLSIDEIKTRLLLRKIELIGEFNGMDNHSMFKCKQTSCGYIWFAGLAGVVGNTHKNGGCPKCAGNLKLNNEIVDERLKFRNIKRLDNYKNNRMKIKFKCLVDSCQHIWEASPCKILNSKRGCPKCSKKLPLNNQVVDDRLKSKNIKRLGEYKNNKTKIEFKCLDPLCGHIWKTKPELILNNNTSCPHCSLGKSEKNIKKLIEKYIKYKLFEPHKPFLFNNRRYVPDFYIENDKIQIIIEYNGRQHYEPVEFGGISKEKAMKIFIMQQKRDRELKEYCISNNIELLEIPYTWKESEIIEKLKTFNI